MDYRCAGEGVLGKKEHHIDPAQLMGQTVCRGFKNRGLTHRFAPVSAFAYRVFQWLGFCERRFNVSDGVSPYILR